MYGKIFESIYEGSLRMNWKAMVTFQQMIVLCDKEGVLDMTPQALHYRTGIPLEIIKEGIEILEQPDGESRSPNEDGRRIVRLDKHRTWGWRLVNHLYYRDLANYEEKKEREKKRSAEKRRQAKEQQNKGVANSCQKLPELPKLPKIQEVAHTDTDTDTNTNTDIKNSSECPQQKIVDLYHKILPQLNKVRVLNSKRRASLRARWNQKVKNKDGLASNCLEWWEGFFKYARTSDFLMGKVNGDRPFQANFDFLIKECSLTKVIEGFYHRKKGT